MRALRISLLIIALAAQAAAASELLVRDARLVDGRGAPPLERVSILVRDGRIAAIGPDLEAPESAPVIEPPG
jgi:N-acyl-D-aspartate/D-glutamate deacylase